MSEEFQPGPWKVRYGPMTWVDAVEGVVTHFTAPPEGQMHSDEIVYEHPYDDSVDAKICPVCHGDPWGEAIE